MRDASLLPDQVQGKRFIHPTISSSSPSSSSSSSSSSYCRMKSNPCGGIFDEAAFSAFQGDHAPFVRMLSSATCSHDGMLIHAYLTKSDLSSDAHIGTAVINMYGKYGYPEDARWVFERLPNRDVVSWNVMMRVFSRFGLDEDAFDLFSQMQHNCVKLTRVSFISVLDVCGSGTLMERGHLVHVCVIDSGIWQDVVVNNALISMYVKSNALVEAHKVFVMMTCRNVVSWTTMISGYVKWGKGIDAVKLFSQMQRDGTDPDSVTFITVLEACARHRLQTPGMVFHAVMLIHGICSELLVGNAIIHMYAKCGSTKDAVRVFDSMHEKDVVTWTAIISAYAHQGQEHESLESFRKMNQQGMEPNKITFVCVIDACASARALVEGRQIHVHILSSRCHKDVDVGKSLLNMYGKCGKLQYVWDLFDRMPEQNVILWTAMISAYSNQGHVQKCVQVFTRMFQEGVIPNEVTYVSILGICRDEAALTLGKHLHSCIVNDDYKRDVSVQNALISMYGNSGSVHNAETIFLGMAERNVVAWTSMMGVYAQNGKGLEALALYERMQQDGIEGDKTTLLCVLDACTSCLALGRGEQELHRFVECGSEIDSVIATSLLNLYGKCGCLDDAKAIFDRIHDRGLVSWTVMIALCAQHGECLVAFELFQQMQLEIFPDDLTFICMLYACSHAGLMQEAQHLFVCMERDYEITPSVFHYACIIDLLGRAGCLDEAETLVNDLSFQPTGELLMALLGACRYNGDVERGEHYAKKMFRANPANAAPYVILSNIYSAWS